MGVDPKARKRCEWCGRKMGPKYYPTRGQYESEHWERPADFARRRFCSRSCQGSKVAAWLWVRPELVPRDAEIVRLFRLGLSVTDVALRLQLKRTVVAAVVQRSRRSPQPRPRAPGAPPVPSPPSR